jgi:hypothetical protein
MNVPPKNILSRNKMNEATVTKPPTETQAARTKPVETRETQTKKLENTRSRSSNQRNRKNNPEVSV